MPKEIKEPQPFSSVTFRALLLHSFLICEKLIILSVKKLGREKNHILNLTLPDTNATGLKQFYIFLTIYFIDKIIH